MDSLTLSFFDSVRQARAGLALAALARVAGPENRFAALRRLVIYQMPRSKVRSWLWSSVNRGVPVRRRFRLASALTAHVLIDRHPWMTALGLFSGCMWLMSLVAFAVSLVTGS